LIIAACATPTIPSSTPPSSSPAISRIACKLPVFNWAWVTTGTGSAGAGKNGFVDLSTGTFTADPNGQIPYDQTTGGYTTD
jgi:hypothetical protein